MAGKGFQFIQCAGALKGFGVELDGGVGGVTARTAAAGFLLVLCMGCRVSAEKKLSVEGGSGVTITGNMVGKDLKVTRNGAVILDTNNIGKNLDCTKNSSVDVSGGANVVGGKTKGPC